MIWQCPECGRHDVKTSSCDFCEGWNENDLSFLDNLNESNVEQAQLHDVKGAVINTWPLLPVTVMQAHRERWFKLLRNSGQGVVFEIGCHRSGVLRSFASHGFDIFGIDVSREAIKDQSQGHEGHFAVSPAERLPVKDQSVDVLLAVHVLEHVSDLEKVLQEIKRVLKPDGRVMVEVPLKDFGDCYEGWQFQQDRDKWKADAALAGHYWEKIPEFDTFHDLLREKGFVVDKVERGSCWMGPLFDRFIQKLSHQYRSSAGKKMSSDMAVDKPFEEKTSIPRSGSTKLVQPKAGKLKRFLSSIVSWIDRIEHVQLASKKNGATAMFLCRVSDSKSS